MAAVAIVLREQFLAVGGVTPGERIGVGGARRK
jgi:hypothetical protein